MSMATLFTILYWFWIATEILLQLVTPTSRKQGKTRDRGSLLVMLSVIFCSVWAAMWYGETHPPTMLGGPAWLRTVAIVIMALGLVLRWSAVLSLGSAFSTNVAIHAKQTLRKSGLYRWMRHPSYTGMLVIFTGLGIHERNWISLAILLVFPGAALLYRIHVEERALTEAFGLDYAEYSRSTRRLIPGVY